MTTMEDIKLTSSSTTKSPYPQVNIRKYSPANRPTTTKRPRSKPIRKFDINKPQGDQPQNIATFLAPGYKLNASDDKSSHILEEILSRVKPKKVEAKGRESKLGEHSNERTEVNQTGRDSIFSFIPINSLSVENVLRYI